MQDIQHVHIKLRAETRRAPVYTGNSNEYLNNKVDQLIRDINMNILIPARCVWVDNEKDTGYTGIACLETSHLAYHFWNSPNPEHTINDGSSLLQLCIYTCGNMSVEEVKTVLDFVSEYDPVLVEASVVDRALSVFNEPHLKFKYDIQDGIKYNEFIERLAS